VLLAAEEKAGYPFCFWTGLGSPQSPPLLLRLLVLGCLPPSLSLTKCRWSPGLGCTLLTCAPRSAALRLPCSCPLARRACFGSITEDSPFGRKRTAGLLGYWETRIGRRVESYNSHPPPISSPLRPTSPTATGAFGARPEQHHLRAPCRRVSPAGWLFASGWWGDSRQLIGPPPGRPFPMHLIRHPSSLGRHQKIYMFNGRSPPPLGVP
jgi:hypothetical protein